MKELVVGVIAAIVIPIIISLWNRFMRKKPRLKLFTEIKEDKTQGSKEEGFHRCQITYGILNKGKAIANHAELSLHVEPYGIDIRWGLTGNGTNGLPRLPTVGKYEIFCADADQVIHPTDKLPVTATRFDIHTGSPDVKDVVIDYQLAAEGIKPVKGTKIIKVKEIIHKILPKT
jgi:hypothetical protein